MIDREERRSEAEPRMVRRRVVRRGPAGGRPAPGRGRPSASPDTAPAGSAAHGDDTPAGSTAGAGAALAGEQSGSAMWGDATPSGDAVARGDTGSGDANGSGGERASRRRSGSVGADAYVGDVGNLGADAYVGDIGEDGGAAADERARTLSSRATAIIPRQRPRPHRKARPSPGGSTDSATGSRPTTAGTGRAKVVTARAAAEPDADGADGAGAAEARPGSTPGTLSRWRLLAGGLVVLLVAALVATGLLARSWYDQRQLDDARDGALAAARQITVNFVSISAATVDRDLKRISDGATGQFKDEFTQDTAQVRAAVVTNKVDSRGTILRAAVVSANLHSAVVLIAIDATVKNSSAPDGRLSHYRIQVNLSRGSSGRWLVSQLQFVG